MRILAIDGGGIRGIYAAHILARIEAEFGVVFHRDFDLIAGTSTGAILAAALATEVPLSKVVRLYSERGASIFRSRLWSFGGLLFPKYSTEPLRSALADVFGEAVMASAKTPFLIPTTDIGNGDVHVVKSAYDPAFTRDPQRRLVDVIVASCSAPLFFGPTIVDRYLLCDGGLWANNPAIVAVTEAMTRLGKDRSEIRLLAGHHQARAKRASRGGVGRELSMYKICTYCRGWKSQSGRPLQLRFDHLSRLEG